MKLGLFVPTFQKNYNKVSASIWIRVYQMMKYYKRLGIDVYINNPLKKYDVVIFYRGVDLKSYYTIKFLKKISKKVYWDQVVNYFEKHKYNTISQVQVAKKIASIVDGIIVPTNYLKQKAQKLHENVFVIPDSIDLEKFNLTKAKKEIDFENPTFIWSGISKKAIFLNDYTSEISGRIILITDNNIKKIPLNFNYTHIHWKYESFEKDILLGDIAFAPRKGYKNPYDLGHSSFKILVFANAGMPVITHKLPSYVELSNLYDGIIFLEDTNENIKAAIEQLKSCNLDPSKVRREYSSKTIAKKLISILEQELVGR